MFERPARMSRPVARGSLAAMAVLAACTAQPGPSDLVPDPASPSAPGAPSDPTLATIALELTTVPSDVRCLRALVTGYEMVTRTVDVTPGAGSQIVAFPSIPVGPAVVYFDAFNVACASVLSNTGQAWVAIEPLMIDLLSNQVTKVSIDLRRPGSLEGSADFVDGTKGVHFGALPREVTTLVGQPVNVQPVELHNDTTAPITVPRAIITGDVDDFQLAFDCADVGPISQGNFCPYPVLFAPKSGGKKRIILKVGGAYSIVTASAIDPSLVRFEPSMVEFGPVVTSTQKTITLTLRNGSELPFATADRGVSSTNFDLVETTCRDQLAPHESCTMVVRFAPQNPFSMTGLAWAGLVQATLHGTGTGTTDGVEFFPEDTDLGNVLIGTTVSPFTIHLRNITPLGFPVTLTLSQVNHVQIDSHNCPAVLPPSSSCAVQLSAHPTNAAAISGLLSAGPGSIAGFISGKTVVPRLTFSPPSRDFGKVAAGQVMHQIFTVTTDVAIPLVKSFPFGYGITGGTCGFSLAAGASCTLDVVFNPPGPGLFSGELSLGQFFPTAKLSGVGDTGVNLSPMANNFGNVTVGQSADATFTISNSSASFTFFPSLEIAGPNANEFQRVGGTCSPSVTPGTACTMVLRFSPLAAGPRSATMSIAPQVNVSALSGTGVSGTVTVTPSPVDYGSVTVGQSALRTFTVANNSGASISTSPSFSPPGDFQVNTTMGTCQADLPTGSSCNLVVRFAPTSAGSKATTLVVGAASASLSGSGVVLLPPISNLIVNDTTPGGDGIPNNQQWSVQSNFQQGVAPFGDRLVTVSSIGSSQLAGKPWIRTTADSKSFTGSPASFTLTGDTVFLLVDNRHNNATTGKPAFLDASYSDTGFDATILEGTTARPYSIWRKSVVSGSTVTLPTVNSTLAPFYFVVVQ
jgi:hypothetical protein